MESHRSFKVHRRCLTIFGHELSLGSFKPKTQSHKNFWVENMGKLYHESGADAGFNAGTAKLKVRQKEWDATESTGQAQYLMFDVVDAWCYSYYSAIPNLSLSLATASKIKEQTPELWATKTILDSSSIEGPKNTFRSQAYTQGLWTSWEGGGLRSATHKAIGTNCPNQNKSFARRQGVGRSHASCTSEGTLAWWRMSV